MLITETHLEEVIEMDKYLSLNYKMKDLGEIYTILGINVKVICSETSLSGFHYIKKITMKFQKLNTKKVSVPFDSSV